MIVADRSPSVFVSYTDDLASHKQAVLEFSRVLVSRQVEVCLDQWYEGRRQDWYKWMLNEIPKADFVLAIASSA
ncbi:SEFIR domain-containing protein [Actinosynnema sp. NPDC091369]